MGRDGKISSVTNAFEILGVLEEKEGLNVSELAKELETSVSTAHRYLKTLHEAEYVVEDDSRYYVGLRFLSHGIQARSRYEGLDLIQEKVRQLADETGERVHFTVPEHGKAVCLAQSHGERAVKLQLSIGDRVPLHTISSGKAILAEWDDERIDHYLDQNDLAGFTENTVADAESLWEQLENIRERGYSQSQREYTGELIGIATTVHGPDESIIGSIAISGPKHRMQGQRLTDELPELLLGTSREVTLNLQYAD